MAHIEDHVCSKCGKKYCGCDQFPYICSECNKREKEEAESNFLEDQRKMSLEERVERLELYLFNNPIPKKKKLDY